jgi:hypothetical protein
MENIPIFLKNTDFQGHSEGVAPSFSFPETLPGQAGKITPVFWGWWPNGAARLVPERYGHAGLAFIPFCFSP